MISNAAIWICLPARIDILIIRPGVAWVVLQTAYYTSLIIDEISSPANYSNFCLIKTRNSYSTCPKPDGSESCDVRVCVCVIVWLWHSSQLLTKCQSLTLRPQSLNTLNLYLNELHCTEIVLDEDKTPSTWLIMSRVVERWDQGKATAVAKPCEKNHGKIKYYRKSCR